MQLADAGAYLGRDDEEFEPEEEDLDFGEKRSKKSKQDRGGQKATMSTV